MGESIAGNGDKSDCFEAEYNYLDLAFFVCLFVQQNIIVIQSILL